MKTTPCKLELEFQERIATILARSPYSNPEREFGVIMGRAIELTDEIKRTPIPTGGSPVDVAILKERRSDISKDVVQQSVEVRRYFMEVNRFPITPTVRKDKYQRLIMLQRNMIEAEFNLYLAQLRFEENAAIRENDAAATAEAQEKVRLLELELERHKKENADLVKYAGKLRNENKVQRKRRTANT